MTNRLIKTRRDHAALMGLAGSSASRGLPAGVGVALAALPGVQKLVFTFTNVAMALTDVASTVAYAGLKFWDAPEGAVKIVGSVMNLVLTKSSAGVVAAANGDISVGTVTASNNATLTSTEANIIASTAWLMAAGVASPKLVTTAAVDLDGTAAAIDAYLNVLVDDADQDVTTTPCNIIVNGTVTLDVIVLGDK